MSAQGEIWRVSTVEGVFEADLDTLKQWIAEGCVLPTDKVSKGNLNWIDAGRAPMLRAAFNGEAGSAAVVIATTDASAQAAHSAASSPDEVKAEAHEEASFEPEVPATPPLGALAAGASVCHNHPEISAKYICRICASTFCAECPKFAGGVSKVALCPLCGDFCRLIEEERSKFQRQEFRSASFGFADFIRALRYPLQHKIALLFGAAFYGFLLLGGFRGQVLAFVIIFGCIARVISQVAWGRLNRSFLPDFSEFSLWDDFALPLGLGIGITIVTLGPMIVLVVLFFFGVVNGSSVSPTSSDSSATAKPAGGPTAKELGALTSPETDPKTLEELNRKLNQTSPGYQISQQAEKSKKEQGDPLANMRFAMNFLQMSLLFLPFILLSIAWAIFYLPMALTVAGYTEHFGSVLNPLVGLDTIRRMRGTYFKAFGMVILIWIASAVVSVIIGFVLSSLDMPFVGNLPASFVNGSITFYFDLVIACVLGLALHKCADRLGIAVD